MSDEKKTLYERLGGYDAITAVANDLLPRLRSDPQRGRFWAHRGEDGVKKVGVGGCPANSAVRGCVILLKPRIARNKAYNTYIRTSPPSLERRRSSA